MYLLFTKSPNVSKRWGFFIISFCHPKRSKGSKSRFFASLRMTDMLTELAVSSPFHGSEAIQAVLIIIIATWYEGFMF